MKRRTLALLVITGILLFGSLGLSGAGRIVPLMANDPDHDGVPDPLDLCPQVNASFFDRNGDGCIDDASGARHTEFWVSADLPFVYRINANGAPGIANGSDFTAIQSAMNAWAAIAGTGFTVSYGGTTPQQAASALDGMNLVTFEDYQYQFSNAVIAVGISTSFTVDSLYNNKQYLPGQIFDADIIFNPVKAFRTPTAGNTGIDIQSVATHEAGHLFGIAHSPVRTSTMFYVLPPGTGAASLSTEDRLVFLKAYADAATLAGANRISGTVTNGSAGGGPMPGAIVWAISAASGDTVAADYTMPDGSYTFLGMANGSYYIGIYPLDGTSAIAGLKPQYINALVETTAVTVFPPEYYDQNESNGDDPTDKTAVMLSGGTKAAGINIVTNVDLTPPEVASINPAAGAMDVRIDAALKLTFSKPIDDATIKGNFKLKDAATQVFITGKATFLKDDSVIVFTPTVPYEFNTLYDLTLKTGLKDIYGNGLAEEYTSSFTTEAMPPLAITSLAPNKGVIGNLIVINGAGFSEIEAENGVSFGGMAAPVVDAYPNRLLVTVPASATTGLVTVTVGGETSNGLTFTVLSATEVARGFQTGVAELYSTPRSLAVLPNGGYAYVATSDGVSIVVIDPGLASYLTVTSLVVQGGLDAMDATPDAKMVYGVSRANMKLYAIDTDPSHVNLFNTIVAEHPCGAVPLGICIDPSGGKAYIPTLEGNIQVWDVRKGSATFESQIGAMSPPDANVRGRMAIDPAGEHLLALSGAGKLNVYDLVADTLAAQVSVLSNPQDVVVDLAGKRAYVSDGTGNVTVVSLQPLFMVQDINTGGALRGMTITPGGMYLYACNEQLNDIDVIDLNESSKTFRSVAATIGLESQPVDIGLSPDGFYAFTAVRDAKQLIVTAIGLGPTLKSISRRAGCAGAKIVLAGSGFGIDNVEVEFASAGGPGTVPPMYSTGTALALEVPEWAVSGPVRVIMRPPDNPQQLMPSNSLYFQVLPAYSGPSKNLRLASGVTVPESMDLNSTLALSPTGDFLVTGGWGGRAEILDTDPSSNSFNQFIGTVDGPANGINSIALSPDGERAFFSSQRDDTVWCYNVNRHSSHFGQLMGHIDLKAIAYDAVTIGKIAISPDGEFLYVPVHHVTYLADSIYVVDIRPGSIDENKTIGKVPGIASRGIAFHPDGQYAYVAYSNTVAVVDVNPLNSTFLYMLNAVAIPDTFGAQRMPLTLATTPDGSRCLVVTINTGGPELWNIFSLNLQDPVNPVIDGVIDTDCGNGRKHTPAIDVSPEGDRAIVALGQCSYYTIDLRTSPISVAYQRFDLSLLATTDMDFTPDGTRFYVTAPYAASDSIYVYDFSYANFLMYISGNEQSGIIDQPLSAPLRVFVGLPDSGMVGVPGVPLKFSVTGGGGYFTDSGQTTRVIATDQNGYAQIKWTLGNVVGTQSQFVTVEAIGLGGSPLQFIADSYDDPAALPLQFTQILPLNGSTGVSVTSLVQGQFTRPVDLVSIVDSTFYIYDPGTTSTVPAFVGFSDSNRKVTLIPKAALNYSASYFVRWTAGIHDADGGALINPGKSSFTTGAKPPLMLTSVTPPASSVGASLVLAGKGFDPEAADNKVLFNDRAVSPFNAGVDYFKVKVPVDAITGQVRVVSAGDTSNTMPFTVLVPSTSPVDEVVASVGTGSSTNSVAVTPDGALAYSVSPEGDVVVPIDVEGQASYPGIQVGDNPVAVAINADGTYAYVCNFGSGTVSVIVVDPDSTTFNKVVETITVGTNPIDVEVNPDGSRVYVANAGSSNVSVIDGDNTSATKNQVLATVTTGSSAKSVVVTPDGTRVYVGTGNGYVVLDAETNGVVGTIATGSSTKSVSITPDGALLVVLTTNGTVVIYDIQPGSSSENEVLATIQTGSTVKSVAVTPDGAMLYIILEDSDNAIAYSLTVVGSVGAFEPGTIIPPPVVSVAPVDTIPTGRNPACITFDPSGSGLAIICNAGDKTVTILNASGLPAGPIPAEVRITPRTLNLKSHGRWVQGRIELPIGYWPEEIDIGSVLLQDIIPVVPGMFVLGEDEDQDGLRELVVKFDRAAFQEILPQGEYIPVTISGTARNRPFIGVDTIRTIRPVVIHPKGEVLTMDQMTNIVWTSPKGFVVDSVSIDWTPNDGGDWYRIARRIPDTHSYPWHVPTVMSDCCRVIITLWARGDILGQGMSQDAFMISVPVAVTVESFSGAFEKEAAVLRWSTLLEQNLEGFNILRSESETDGYECITAKPIPAGGSSAGGSYEFTDPDVGLNRTYFYKLEGTSNGGSKDLSGPYKVICRAPFALAQNAPNPFNPSTAIKFTIAEDSYVTLAVYDVAGRRVTTLVDRSLKANFYRVEWDGRNDEGRKVTSGVYFYRLHAGAFVQSHKMILLR